MLAGLLGALSMATGVVLTKRWERPVPLLAFTSWQLVAGGFVVYNTNELNDYREIAIWKEGVTL